MTTHRHHRKLRSQGGTDAPENILYITPETHAYIHAHVGEAYERGWLVKSWQDPAEVPILSWPEAAGAGQQVTVEFEPNEVFEAHSYGGVTFVPEAAPEPKPGSKCPTCNRRVNHPKKATTPDTASISYRVPLDEIEAHKDVFETAARFLGTFERPHWRYWTVTFALVALMQDESMRGQGQRAPLEAA